MDRFPYLPPRSARASFARWAAIAQKYSPALARAIALAAALAPALPPRLVLFRPWRPKADL